MLIMIMGLHTVLMLMTVIMRGAFMSMFMLMLFIMQRIMIMMMIRMHNFHMQFHVVQVKINIAKMQVYRSFMRMFMVVPAFRKLIGMGINAQQTIDEGNAMGVPVRTRSLHVHGIGCIAETKHH